MSKTWGGIGAWALDAEAEERELAAAAAAAESAPTPLSAPPQSFPSLKEAAASKPKKKKPVAIPLAQFAAAASRADELLRLPTAPRERDPEELEFAGRRGFSSSYGGGGGGGGGGFGPRRGYGDDETRRGAPPPPRVDMGPSRADEVDNWAAGKRQFTPSIDRGHPLDRLGSSRADEVDNWAVGKKPASSFGQGFRSSSGASDSDRWTRGGGLGSANDERRKLVLDPPKKDVGPSGEPARTEMSKPSPFGAARPREEVLAEKGLDWRKIDLEIESKKSSRPSSAQSSRPSSAQSSRAESPGGVVVRARPKVNPFGDAKPREVLLEAKGKDWRKIDLELEHREVDRPETDEEKLLKEEINRLKAQTRNIEENLKTEPTQFSEEELVTLQEQILRKERELEILTLQLDDKVRFGQKTTFGSRPSSGAGRSTAPLDSRPRSRSDSFEETRSTEFMLRPQSRGGVADSWAQSADDKRGFQGGYFGDRNLDRPKSRGRW